MDVAGICEGIAFFHIDVVAVSNNVVDRANDVAKGCEEISDGEVGNESTRPGAEVLPSAAKNIYNIYIY